MTRRLARSFFAADSRFVAPKLLGCVLAQTTATGVVSIRVTEVEAYAGVGEDPASHAHRGVTPRNAVMFGPAGYLYVYFVYGMHWCANVVCGPPGRASAVLLRAGEVTSGVDVVSSRRRAVRANRELTSGPARLASALALDGEASGMDLCARDSKLWFSGRHAQPLVDQGPRVGVSSGREAPWRWWIRDDPTVSAWRSGKRPQILTDGS